MKKAILYLFVVLLVLPFATNAQVQDGMPLDSATITFAYDSTHNFISDTSASPLWQIGHSHKSFFGIDSTGKVTMLTDTINSYRINANNWFVIKIPGYYNTIVDFWHKYQTSRGHDGGIVEFSKDHGVTWQNMKGPCNMDSFYSCFGGILTTNFYSFIDTLDNGEPAFSGTSGHQMFSRFQFAGPCPVRISSGISGCPMYADTFYVRFRFVSDRYIDFLAGWQIDSIKIEHDQYAGGGVKNSNKPRSLATYPNPSYDGIFTFPALENEQDYTTEVYNAIGQKVMAMPYRHSLDLSHYAKGLNFYKVTDGKDYYSGQLEME